MEEKGTALSHTGVSQLLHIHEEIPSIASPLLGDIGIFSIATSTMTIIFITALVIGLALYVKRHTLVPTSFQSVLELFYEKVSEFITSIIGSKAKAEKVIPYVGSIMVYLIIANVLPLVPFLSSVTVIIGGESVPLFRGATTDFNTTFSLALAVVLVMQVVGMKEQGVLGYLSHFIQIKQVVRGFRKSFGEGMIAVIGFFVGLIEIISEVAKSLSLSLRLFGNMFAHEVLMVILLGAFSVAVPALWMGMGLLVGLVQSVVFVALVTVYYSLVLKQEGKEH